jgi:methionyl-tRNA synthetase
MNISHLKTEYNENQLDSLDLKMHCLSNEIIFIGNKYLQDNEPWKLVKVDSIGLLNRYCTCQFQIVGTLSYLLKPLLPKTSTKIDNIFNVDLIKS